MAVLIAAVTLAHFVGAGSVSPPVIELRNSLHAPSFLLLVVLAYIVLRREQAPNPALIYAVTGAVACGLAGEFGQYIWVGQPSLGDLKNDVVGIGAGTLIALSVEPKRRFRHGIIRFLLIAIAIAATVGVGTPAVKQGAVLAARTAALPVLLTFDEDWERTFFEPQNSAVVLIGAPPTEWPVADGQAALVQLSDDSYSGIEIHVPGNWEGYESLSFVVASVESSNLSLGIRIDDRGHSGHYTDRFGTNVQAGTIPQRFRIPLSEVERAPAGRKMKMHDIRTLILFRADQGVDGGFWLDDIRLENE